MRLFSIVILLFISSLVHSQDTTQFIPNRQYSHTEKQISVRVGTGIQKNAYAELGASLHSCTYGCTGFFANDGYSAIEWTPVNNIYGLKIGYEANIPLLNVGIETKYQTNFTKNDFVITPKIGLGIFGDVNLFYGYHISTNGSPFPEIGHHQFSLILNLNNHFLGYR